MGILFAWAVGYVVGARSGVRDFDDVVQAVKEVRDSEEVRDLLAVLRSHAAHILHSTAQFLEQAPAPDPNPDGQNDLLDRVRRLMGTS
jgi:hypothetical protein